MSNPPLPRGVYAVCDDGVRPDLLVPQKARLAIAGGVRVLQVRIKLLPFRDALRAIRDVVGQCRASSAACIVNDRPDWALLAGAQGVHVGEEDVPVADARAALGPDRYVGATTRSLGAVRRAVAEGADHVGVGPVFASSTKPLPHALLGLEGLSAVCGESPCPVVAISGIQLENIEAVAAAGAHCAAVASALWDAADVPARAFALSAAFERGARRRSVVP